MPDDSVRRAAEQAAAAAEDAATAAKAAAKAAREAVREHDESPVPPDDVRVQDDKLYAPTRGGTDNSSELGVGDGGL